MYTLTGSYSPANGSPAFGWVDVVPDIVAVADGVTIVQQPVRAALQDGSFSLSVIASDDASWTLPDGQRMPYIIRESVEGLERGWMAYLDGTGGDVADLVPLVEAPDMGTGYLTQAQADALYVNVAGDSMPGTLTLTGDNGGTGVVHVTEDTGIPGTDALELASPDGVLVRGPYLVLDTQNLIATLSGGQVGSPMTIVGFDQLGGALLGWGPIQPQSWVGNDEATAPVTIKLAGQAVPSAWVELGLAIVLGADMPAGLGTVSAVLPIRNASTRTGTLEIGIKVNNGTITPQTQRVSIAAGQDSTIAVQGVNAQEYSTGDIVEVVARVVAQDNSQFSLTMDADTGTMALFRVTIAAG